MGDGATCLKCWFLLKALKAEEKAQEFPIPVLMAPWHRVRETMEGLAENRPCTCKPSAVDLV